MQQYCEFEIELYVRAGARAGWGYRPLISITQCGAECKSSRGLGGIKNTFVSALHSQPQLEVLISSLHLHSFCIRKQMWLIIITTSGQWN